MTRAVKFLQPSQLEVAHALGFPDVDVMASHEEWLKRQAAPVAHIIIFKAGDGRWAYSPNHARGTPAFNLEGQFDTAELALEAVKADSSIPAGSVLTVEKS